MKKRKIDVPVWILIAVIVFGFGLPKIVDLLFSTSWGELTELHNLNTHDFISFWGALMGVISTLILAIVTLKQNARLMTLEDIKFRPLVTTSRSEGNIKSYEKIRVTDELTKHMRFTYKDPGINFSFWIKNASQNYVSNIIVQNLQITGFDTGAQLRGNHYQPENFITSHEEINSIFPSGLLPEEEKQLEICFKSPSTKSIVTFDLLMVNVDLKLVHLYGESFSTQFLRMLCLVDAKRTGKFYIISTGSFNESNIKDLNFEDRNTKG